MKKPVICLLLIPLFFFGCASKDIRSSVKSAQDFQRMFVDQIASTNKVDSLSGGGGWAKAYSTQYTLPILDSNYAHKNTYKTALQVFSKWKKKYGLENVAAGGGANRFSMAYQDEGTYKFVNVISYKDFNNQNVIDFIISAH